MHPLRQLVADRIRLLGEAEACEFFGVTSSTIRSWKAGHASPSLAAVEKVWEPPKAVEEAAWTGRDLAILLPFYKQCHPMTLFSLMALWDRSKMRLHVRSGDAFISHARNELAKEFLATDCEWSFWCDDDLILPIGHAAWFKSRTGFNMPDAYAGLHTLNRLRSHGKTLVGGVYFGRSRDGKPMYAEGANNRSEADWIRQGPHNIVKPTGWVATGCMLVHRSVYLDIAKKYPHLDGQWFSSGESDLLVGAQTAFDALVDGHVEDAKHLLADGLSKAAQRSPGGLGEDITFCTRAAAAGHQPFVDCALFCGHVGGTCYGPQNTNS